jgi:hypothetical protein
VRERSFFDTFRHEIRPHTAIIEEPYGEKGLENPTVEI